VRAPNEVGPSFEETACQIWVAAMCPVNSDQYPFVVWENWIEQAQLYPADPSNGLKVLNSGGAGRDNLSSVNTDGTDGITLLQAPPADPIGFPQPLPSKNWIRREFVWSLLLACPGANCHFNLCAP
jgi:hypothetical protein